jgi:hypothetical protein
MRTKEGSHLPRREAEAVEEDRGDVAPTVETDQSEKEM